MLVNLLVAYEYARDADGNVWQFAIGLEILRALGLTPRDVDWLLSKGYVEQRIEVTRRGDRRRSFLPPDDYQVNESSSFVLTESGRQSAEEVLRRENQWHAVSATIGRNLGDGEPSQVSAKPAAPGSARSNIRTRVDSPCWNRETRELHVGKVLVKRFRVPAPNQEKVLDAFEEEGWPPRIDDPLPPVAKIAPRQRLRDTIKALNRNRKTTVLRFAGDGNAEGVQWRLDQMLRKPA